MVSGETRLTNWCGPWAPSRHRNTIYNEALGHAAENSVGEGSSLGQPVHAQLLLERHQLRQADVAAPTDNDHKGGQRGAEFPLSLQLLNHVAVDGGQGGPTGGLHQDLLVICQRKRMVELEPGNLRATGEAISCQPWPQTGPGPPPPTPPSLPSIDLLGPESGLNFNISANTAMLVIS